MSYPCHDNKFAPIVLRIGAVYARGSPIAYSIECLLTERPYAYFDKWHLLLMLILNFLHVNAYCSNNLAVSMLSLYPVTNSAKYENGAPTHRAYHKNTDKAWQALPKNKMARASRY